MLNFSVISNQCVMANSQQLTSNSQPLTYLTITRRATEVFSPVMRTI
jgi:hypothetical protein